MKAVMISTQPKWCELKASGKKTIEVRKTRPKIDTPFKCYIYETYDKKYVGVGTYFFDTKVDYKHHCKKVIGEFVCDRIEEYTFFTNLAKFSNMGLPCGTFSSYLIFEDDYKKMCLSYDEVKKYGNGKTLYGWHISDLVIYDKPKELSEFNAPCPHRGEKERDCPCNEYGWNFDEKNGKIYCTRRLTRPPQSWQYVEEKENENE